MNRFAVRQQDDSKIPPAGLRDLTPAPNPTVGLNLFLYRGSPRAFDPDILDCSAVGPSPYRIKVRGGLHMAPSGRSALSQRGRTRTDAILCAGHEDDDAIVLSTGSTTGCFFRLSANRSALSREPRGSAASIWLSFGPGSSAAAPG